MKRDFNSTFLFSIIILTIILTFFVLKPFLIALTLAFILSQLFKNQYQKVYHRIGKRASLASVLVCFFIFFSIFVPIAIALGLMGNEINNAYESINQDQLPAKIDMFLKNVPLEEMGLNINTKNFQSAIDNGKIIDSIKSLGNLFYQVVKKTYQGATQFFFMVFVMFFSLYYLLKEDKKIIRFFNKVSPLRDKQEMLLLKNFVDISRSTLKGTFVIAIIQATLAGITLVIAGVPSPVTWAVVCFILSLIPFVGAALVMVPIGLFLLVTGSVWQGIFMIVSAVIIIGSVDNFLRPKLVEGGSGLHPLLVFLSTLGGISFFGITGFLLGPAVIVFLSTLLKIYQLEFKNELKKFNR